RPCELRLLRDGAPPLLVEMTITPSRDARRVMLIRDISKQREIQQRMIQTDRLAAIGTLAAGVAHEINNPLTYMSCNAQMLLEWFAVDRVSPERIAEARSLLEEIVQGVDQVAGIVKDLATVAREPSSDRGPTDLGAILKTSLKIASSHIVTSARVRRAWGRCSSTSWSTRRRRSPSRAAATTRSGSAPRRAIAWCGSRSRTPAPG